MARAALGWSPVELGKQAAVGANTVNRFEAGRDARVSSVDKMRAALEVAGVEFIPENGGGAGVRIRNKYETGDYASDMGQGDTKVRRIGKDPNGEIRADIVIRTEKKAK